MKALKQVIKRTALSLAFGSAIAANAHAGLVGVESIQISNANNDWLQVAEVAAINTTSVNVAAASNGGTASAPSTWNGFSTANKAIDGNIDGNFWNGSVFHSGSTGPSQILTISLASPQELNFFQIWGRNDCCSSRDIYNVSFLDSFGNLLFAINALDATRNFAEVALPNSGNVPEPMTTGLIGLGLMAFAVARRKAK